MTNICHVFFFFFVFVSSPLGKRQVQWHGQFWSGFCVWDCFEGFWVLFFWVFFRILLNSNEKRQGGKIAQSSWSGREKYLWSMGGAAHLPQSELGELLIILGFFGVGEKQSLTLLRAQDSLLDWREWSGSWLDSSLGLGTVPGNTGAPLARAGSEQKSHLRKLYFKSLGLDSCLFTGYPKWDFSGWEVANRTPFWDCCSLCEKDSSFERAWKSSSGV